MKIEQTVNGEVLPDIPNHIMDEHNLRWHDGKFKQPAFAATPKVWATDERNHYAYTFFNGGTNRLVILRILGHLMPDKSWEWSMSGGWSKCEIDEIDSGDLHGLIWKWTLAMEQAEILCRSAKAEGGAVYETLQAVLKVIPRNWIQNFLEMTKNDPGPRSSTAPPDPKPDPNVKVPAYVTESEGGAFPR